MITDRFISHYIELVQKERDQLRDGVMSNSTITLEEVRRNQGIYEGLDRALALLRDTIETENV